jgi:hypothetical protein
MAEKEFAAKRQSFAELNDITHLLVTDMGAGTLKLQELACICLSRANQSDIHRDIAVNDAISLIKLLVTLAEKSVQHDMYVSSYYISALYDFGCFVLTDWPADLDIDNRVDEVIHYSREPRRNKIESVLFDGLQKVIPLFVNAPYRSSRDWHHPTFSLIAVSLETLRLHKRESLERHIQETFKLFIGLLTDGTKKKGLSVNFDYLQLIGAWILQYLNKEGWADNIASFIAENKPFSTHDSSPGIYGRLGYPSINFHDFYLKQPGNRLLSVGANERLKGIAAAIMSDDILRKYYGSLEKIRAPLRKAFYENLQEKKNKKQDSDNKQ